MIVKSTKSITDADERLARTLRNRRAHEGITLKELSARTGINDGYLSLLETGKRPISEENFMKIFAKGFKSTETEAKKIWSLYLSDVKPEGKRVSKNIAEAKYKVVCRGFDDYFHERILLARWVINGKIYRWRVFNGRNKSEILIKDPLTSEEHRAEWKVVSGSIGNEETQWILSALQDEIRKVEPVSNTDKSIQKNALIELEDLHDAIASINE